MTPAAPGYAVAMAGKRHAYEAGLPENHLGEHALGLELEMTETAEQWRRAIVQGRTRDAGRLAADLECLGDELVATAESAARAAVRPSPTIDAVRARPAA
jgi:hypothetical protein